MVLVDPVLAAVRVRHLPLLPRQCDLPTADERASPAHSSCRAEVAEVAHELRRALLVKVMGRRRMRPSDSPRSVTSCAERRSRSGAPRDVRPDHRGDTDVRDPGAARDRCPAGRPPVVTTAGTRSTRPSHLRARLPRAARVGAGEIPRTWSGGSVSAVPEARGQMTYGETHLPGEAAPVPESPSGVRVGFEAVSYDHAVASPPALAAAAPDATAGDRRGGGTP